MTIVAGFRCSNGVIVCADRQLSVPGSHKYYEKKIRAETGDGWQVIFAYAGLPGVAREAQEKIVAALRKTEISALSLKNIADDVLTQMSAGRQYGDFGAELLIAYAGVFEEPELFKFDGKGLHTADDFNILGVGESSLIRFLSDKLYSRKLNTELGAMLAVYLIHKASQYVDHCGGPIDVATLVEYEESAQWLPDSEVEDFIESFDEREKKLINLLIPYVSSNEP